MRYEELEEGKVGSSYRTISAIVLCVACLGQMACNMDREYTLNPNGSGKVRCAWTMKYHGLLFLYPFLKDSKPALEEEARHLAANEIRNASGIETWSDVSIKISLDGSVSFEGTAYFVDINKVRLYPLMSNQFLEKPTFSRGQNGGVILDFVSGIHVAGNVTRFSDDELEEIIRVKRAELKRSQKEWGFLDYLINAKSSVSVNLPGPIESCTNMSQIVDNKVKVEVEGKKLVEALREFSANDDFMRRHMRAGGGEFSIEALAHDEVFVERLFGKKGTIRVETKKDLRAQFDYDKEVAEAKKNFDPMIKRLGIDLEKRK